MTVGDVRRLFDYGYWANGRLFEVMSQLSADEFTRRVGGSYGSLRDALVHMLNAEWGWLDRCGGHRRGQALDPASFPTLESIAATWRTVEGHLRAFLSGLADSDLAREVEFTNPRGERRSMAMGELLQHAANHGVHHRGQVTLLLRMLGRTPGNIDLLIFDVERRAARQE
ncbi:MAG TPA: DinB family protein [Vicinamibacteria bacterium]|nr:DinB family protein [Vicinamibacteria bacterium]